MTANSNLVASILRTKLEKKRRTIERLRDEVRELQEANERLAKNFTAAAATIRNIRHALDS